MIKKSIFIDVQHTPITVFFSLLVVFHWQGVGGVIFSGNPPDTILLAWVLSLPQIQYVDLEETFCSLGIHYHDAKNSIRVNHFFQVQFPNQDILDNSIIQECEVEAE